MMNFIQKANLPEKKVKTVICGSHDSKIIDFFNNEGIEILFTESNSEIDHSVSEHADMAALHIGGNKIILDKKQFNLSEELKIRGSDVSVTQKSICGRYPCDVGLNFTVIGDYVIGNLKYADPELKKLISDKKVINVNQGYCKCSTLVLSENTIITDDESIHKKVSENGINSLLISKGDIYLKGHNYGFIGGASGKISAKTVVFFGDIRKHCDYSKIESFLSGQGFNLLITDEGTLRDIGGFISISE